MSKSKPESNKLHKQQNTALLNGDLKEITAKNFPKNLFAHVDISSIVFLRIGFGVFMLIEMIRFYSKIERYWIAPKFHFTYLPFDFLTPLPGNGMYIIFIMLMILAVFIILGLFYRVSMTLFFFGWTYIFLLEQARYLNHHYLISLMSFVMIFVPANAALSIDKKIFKKIYSETTYALNLWLLRFMIALPYFFGGIAKINEDWLHGEPFGSWLLRNTNNSNFSGILQQHGTALFMSYFSLIFDLLIVPVLLNKKTRTTGFLIAILFHLMNSYFFDIGIFPWFMIVVTTIFFSPEWFRRFINFFNNKFQRWPMKVQSKDKILAPVILNRFQKIIMSLLIIWSVVMITIPLRHFFIPGNVNWTEEGQKFSWHMKLSTKNEIASFIVKNKSTNEIVPFNINYYLRSWQKKNMQDKPNLIWQFGQIVKSDYKKKGVDVAVYANIQASLNGRKFQPLIDSKIDIASVPYDYFSHSDWIVPLETPFSDRLVVRTSP